MEHSLQHGWWGGDWPSETSPPPSCENNPSLPLSPRILVVLTLSHRWPDDLVNQGQPISTPVHGSGAGRKPKPGQSGPPCAFSWSPWEREALCLVGLLSNWSLSLELLMGCLATTRREPASEQSPHRGKQPRRLWKVPFEHLDPAMPEALAP